jgi:hypothetical protein
MGGFPAPGYDDAPLTHDQDIGEHAASPAPAPRLQATGRDGLIEPTKQD